MYVIIGSSIICLTQKKNETMNGTEILDAAKKSFKPQLAANLLKPCI
jgi:hypothetical protein